MPAVSDEDLQELQDENEKLRERLAKANAKRGEQEAAREREYTGTMLAAENIRLQAQVEAAEETAKVDNTKEGVSTVQFAAEDQLAQAKAVLEAPARPDVSPQPSNTPDENKTGGN